MIAAHAATFVRFMTHVQVGKAAGDCWIWIGNKPDGRYGHFSVNGQIVKAHRWIYEHLYTVPPDGMVVRHKCDNPQCVNPIHLTVGTPADNTRDKFERGRAPDRRGTKHPLSKLTEEQVLEIRRLASCGATQAYLAGLFNVARGQIGKIVNRENWRHI